MAMGMSVMAAASVKPGWPGGRMPKSAPKRYAMMVAPPHMAGPKTP